MKKLFLAALCSMSLLSVARGEEGRMSSGDSMQHGDAMAQDKGTGSGGSMAPDSTETSSKDAKDADKTNADTKMQDDGMKPAGSMEHDDKMDDGKTK